MRPPAVDRWLFGRLVYPTVVRALGEGSLFSRLRQLESMQWWEPMRLAEYQTARLADILNFASRHTRHFRALLPTETIKPGDAYAVLNSLPFLNKADLQTDSENILAVPAPGRIAFKTTGGSTGQAVTVAKDAGALAYERAAMWLGYGWAGIRFGDRCARFWGSQFSGRRRAIGRAGDFAMNRVRFSAFAFDDSDLERYWQRCLQFRPAYLYGYVSMLEAFASFIERRGYEGRRIGARAVITTSEVLTLPQRGLLERVFGARVSVEYGCGEVGPVAYECEHGSLHLMSADLVVELVDEAGRPTTSEAGGSIVLTDLNSRAMPLLRYRIGDNGVMGGACDCGRGFPVLAKIWGRAYDVIRGTDGRRYHGEFFMYLFEDLRKLAFEIRQFQVIQDHHDHLTVKLVADPQTVSHVSPLILQRLEGSLPRMRITVEPVARLDRSPSGKMQVVRNLLPDVGRP